MTWEGSETQRDKQKPMVPAFSILRGDAVTVRSEMLMSPSDLEPLFVLSQERPRELILSIWHF